MTPQVQERFHCYVLGPNQDSRLASVAAGQTITGLELQIDPDAPFVLRSRAVRQKYTSALTQNGLQFLSSRWTGQLGKEDYRFQALVNEACQMPNFGQCGNPKPIWPHITYPANGLIVVDIQNTGTSAISNLQLFWFGVKRYPWGSVQGYTYPKNMAAIAFNYQIPITNLGVSERRSDVPFTITENDFVLRGGQATAPFLIGGESNRVFAEVGIILKDESKKPFMNDFVPLDVLFGSGGFPSVFPLGTAPSFLAPFGPGPALPGLIYPEIYIPNQHTMWYSLLRSDGAVNANQSESFTISFVGAKVYPQ
jgi:hypothetical protein